jgi:multidrug efflux system outer membrane protein
MLAGKDYRKPETPAREGFVNTEGVGRPEEIETAWWRGFGDDELARLIELAVEQNHDIRIAAARLREARELRFQTQLDLLPTVTSEGAFTRERTSEARLPSGSSIDREREVYEAGFDASWELDLFGRVRRALEAKKAEEEAEEELLRDVLVSIQAEVARNYFELRGTENRLAVARRNAQNQQQTLDLTLARLEGGRGTELDTSRSRAQLHSTLAGIPLREAAIEQSRHRLCVLTGRQPGELQIRPPARAALPDLTPVVAVGTPGDLLRRRPDVRAAERLLAAATARAGVAVGDLYPRVTMNGSISLEANKLSELGSSGSEAFGLGPRIFWPAFDLGRVLSRIRAADARTEATLAAFERAVLAALEETENALVVYGREQRSLNELRVAAEASEQASRLAHERYEFGVSDFLVVLDAERTLLEAQDRLAETETRAATALVAVYKALGGGWLAIQEEASEGSSPPYRRE